MSDLTAKLRDVLKEKKMSNENVIDGDFEEMADDIIINETETEDSDVTVSVTPYTKADEIVQSISNWAQDNPTTALAVGGVTAGLAVYGAYRGIKAIVA